MSLGDMIQADVNSVTGALDALATNIVDGLMAILGKGKDPIPKYPTTFGLLEAKAFTNAPNYTDGTWKESKGYAFEVVRVKNDNGSYKITQIADERWQEFRLQINPQELKQDEIFAIEATPTFRGVIVEHHGAILKDIVISGTTGISPMRASGGANKKTGRPVMAGGHSGFEEFHELRSYIRAYVEYKRIDTDPNNKGELRLIFKNLKDNEYLYVEPQKFTMNKTVQRRTLYEYIIVLKGIGVAYDPNAGGKDNGGLLGAIGDILDTATDLINYSAQVMNGSVGLIRRVEADVTNTILGPLNAVGNALGAIKNGRAQLLGEFGITRRFMERLDSEVRRVEANFNESIGRDISDYNDATGRTPTVVGSTRDSTYTELQVLNGFNAASRALNITLSENTLLQEDVDATNDRIKGYYGDDFSPPAANSTREKSVDGNDTVQTLAARELGDPDRYKEIVTLNNLKPPYIDEAGGEGILKPGEKVLLPQRLNTENTGVKKNKEYNITKQLGESEKNFGIDIRLNKDNDLAISSTKDLDLIGGVLNMSQAILVRLYLEKGSLKRHPSVGTNLVIGRKSVLVEDVKNNIVESFASDLRVESIPYIDLTQEGNEVRLNMVVKLKNIAQPVPLPITVIAA